MESTARVTALTHDLQELQIVDDVSARIPVLGELLRGAAYRVKVVDSGRTALRSAVRERRSDLSNVG